MTDYLTEAEFLKLLEKYAKKHNWTHKHWIDYLKMMFSIRK